MNHVYYLIEVPAPADSYKLKELKAVRDAMRILSPEATATDAERAIQSVRERGWAILGTSETMEVDDVLARVREHLPREDFAVAIDIDTASRERRWKSRELTKQGATPEQVFSELAPGERTDEVRGKAVPIKVAHSPISKTAFTCLLHADGNPVHAAAMALQLGRNSGQDAFYRDVVRFIIEAAPWVDEMLRASGAWNG